MMSRLSLPAGYLHVPWIAALTRSTEGKEGDARSAGMLLLVPLLLLAACVAVLALLAAFSNWTRSHMLVIATVAGALTLVGAAFAIASQRRQSGQRVTSARALHSAESQVAGIVESAMDAIIATDAKQRVLLYNKAAETVFGWPRNAVLGQPLEMLIPQRFRAAHTEHIARFEQTGAASRRMGGQTVLTGLRANGQEFSLEASISQLRHDDGMVFTVILRDVSAKARTEHMLERSEARLRGILDSAMDAIITIDANQHIVIFNAAAEQMFGCPGREAIGAPLDWFIPQQFRGAHADHVRSFGGAASSGRRMGALRVVKGLRRNGEEFPLEASISHTSDGDAIYYTVLLRDVTERDNGVAALIRSREELREFAAAASSVREQEKGRIARELHDELAQGLTALKMDLNWAAARVAAGDGALVAKIAAMQSMLDGTVAATRRIAADLRPLMLDDLGLVPAAQWLVQGFRERSGIRCEIDVNPPGLELDEPYATAVFRILQESLTNAARHAHASLVRIGLHADAHDVTLTVHDNGRGFATGDPLKLDSYGLMGLRERVLILDGEVAIESAAGSGTRIEVRIPLASAGQRAAPAAASALLDNTNKQEPRKAAT